VKHVNPLHIGVLLIVTILFLFVKLSETKDELRASQASYKSAYTLAQKLQSLKNLYAQKQTAQKALHKIVTSQALQKSDVKSITKRDKTYISAKKIDLRALNYLLSKLLNGSFIIESLKVERVNEKEADLEMEIKW